MSKPTINISTDPADRYKWNYWLNWHPEVQEQVLAIYGLYVNHDKRWWQFWKPTILYNVNPTKKGSDEDN